MNLDSPIKTLVRVFPGWRSGSRGEGTEENTTVLSRCAERCVVACRNTGLGLCRIAMVEAWLRVMKAHERVGLSQCA